jgi:hypothetical protein
MNGCILEPVRWTRRRWFFTILWVFAVQAGLSFALGRRSQPPPERPRFVTGIQLPVDEQQIEKVMLAHEQDDPLLLALPNLRGFSGPAWLYFAPLDYSPAESPEPLRSLELSMDELGSGFTRFVETNRISPLLVANKPMPPLIRYEPRFSNETLPAESSMQLQGELSGRALAVPIRPRSWAHSELLSNSVVQVAVDPDGMTFSPVLLSESGWREADLHALQLARDARFEPLPREARVGAKAGFIWGRLVFRWHTVTGPLTESTGANP